LTNAEKDAVEVLRLNNSNFRGYTLLGGLRFLQERWNDAIEQFRKALTLCTSQHRKAIERRIKMAEERQKASQEAEDPTPQAMVESAVRPQIRNRYLAERKAWYREQLMNLPNKGLVEMLKRNGETYSKLSHVELVEKASNSTHYDVNL
jgi:hypothetical protein